ncbi:serine hydrolase [Myxosarcina sp. GI1]|uniref:serine hydrolase domain-containing protein n=1 Tax=Myxosarcina sp. GI1 TaxID=1541065 RepID=UPI00068F5210|nr:serine hydrolase [Myxosarcina sp. GI1]
MSSPAQDSQDKQYLSASESNPIKISWMQGFPPPEDKRLSAADGSFFEFPALRYSVVHMRQFMPTVNVSRGIKNPAVLFEYDLDENIESLTFVPWDSDEEMTFEASLRTNYTDGILILHQGKIVFEEYFAALTEVGQHAAMSVTKSFTGTLAEMLVAEGTLDDSKTVVEYVPELENSAFADATVREVMDMTTALKFSEDYSDPNAEIWQYATAGSPLPKPKDYDRPIGYYEYLQTVQKDGEHGEAFAYKSVNADALGWIISKATGKPVNQLLSEKIWQNLGMEQDGYYNVDELATPSAAGGLSAGLRDLGRFGEMMRRGGSWQGEQAIPQSVVEDIQQGGSQEKFAKSDYDKLKGWSYRNQWWITNNEDGAFAARGVHGQTIYIDPTAEMVIVRFASHPVAANSANDPYSLPAYQAVADYLIEQN